MKNLVHSAIQYGFMIHVSIRSDLMFKLLVYLSSIPFVAEVRPKNSCDCEITLSDIAEGSDYRYIKEILDEIAEEGEDWNSFQDMDKRLSNYCKKIPGKVFMELRQYRLMK